MSGFASKNKKGEYVKPSREKVVGYAFLYLFTALFFAAFATVLILSVGKILIPFGLSAQFFGIVNSLSFAVIFIFSIFETKAELFDCKDNELMISMPIRPGHLVIARIIMVLIYNYLISAVFTIPSTVIYAVLSGGEIKGIVGSLIISIVTPLAATALASAVGYAVALISKKMKNKTLATVLISLVFLALYFWGYTELLGSASGNDIATALVNLTNNIGFIAYLGKASLLFPANTAVYMLVCIGLSFIAYAVIQKFYFSIITMNYSASSAGYKKKELKRRSTLVALSKKEFSKFFSSSTYMLNCGLGLLFATAAGIFLIIKREMFVSLAEAVTYFVPDADPQRILALGSAALIIMTSSISYISSCALSLEGDSLWVLKSMPVKSRDVLISKTVPHIILSLPFVISAAVMAAITFKLDAVSTVLLFLTVILSTVISGFVGVILNVAFPKFKYNNETEPIKQSASTFLTMLSMLVVTAMYIALGVIGVVNSFALLMQILLTLLLAVIAIVLWFILTGACVRRYDSF